MRQLFSSLAVLAMVTACTSGPQNSETAPQGEDPAGPAAVDAETQATTPMSHEDDRTRAILFRLKGPEEERPTNRR